MSLKALTRGKADVYTNKACVKSGFKRIENKGRETAKLSHGATVVVASHKVSFNPQLSLPLSTPRKNHCYDRNPAGGGFQQIS